MYKNAPFTKKGEVQECIVFWSYTTASAGTDAKIDATGNIGTKATMDIGTNTDYLPISLPQAQQGSKSPGPILLAPNPVVATQARSASPHPIGSRKSPQLLEKEVSAALPLSKSPAL